MSDAEATVKTCHPGAPAWVLTFADLMSLLLAFFVLMFSFSELDKAKYKEVAGSMREAFGIQREIKIKEPPKGLNIIAQEFSAGTPDPTVLNQLRQHTTDDFNQFLQLTRVKTNTDQQQVPTAGEPVVQESKIESLGDRIRGFFKEEISEGLVELEIEDPRIIIRILERGSFSSGSTDLIEPFKSIIEKMAKAIKITPGNVIVAGHTDNVPIANRRYRSNWELSASRAVTVVHELLKPRDIRPDRFRIEGYADMKPIDTNNTEKGRARNRRVEVTVVYDETEIDAMVDEQTQSTGMPGTESLSSAGDN